MNVVLLLVLMGVMHAARSFTDQSAIAGDGTALAFGFVLLCGHLAGGLFRDLHLPRITGYLTLGLVAGPQGLELVTAGMVQDLGLLNGVAVALIALAAGVEMEFADTRPLLRAVGWITLIAVCGTALLLAATTYALKDHLAFMAALPGRQALALALVLGTMMAAQSPAVVVALRAETRAAGPVIRTVLAVVVLADLVVIVLFALASSAAKAAFGASGALAATLSTLAWQLLGSVVAGGLLGVVLALYLGKVAGGAPLFVLTVAFVIAEVGGRLDFDPLLVALVAGIFVRNLTSAHRELARAIEALGPPVYAVFFAVAGANIQPRTLLSVSGLLVVLFVVRAAGLLGGAWIAGGVAGLPPPVRRHVGWGLVPQAGLALALALLFQKVFPELGPEPGALIVGLVALNELVAPIMFRMSLVRSGEAEAVPAERPLSDA